MSTRTMESEIRTLLDKRLGERKRELQQLAELKRRNQEAIRHAEEAKRLIERA
jgi:hypothetical protein